MKLSQELLIKMCNKDSEEQKNKMESAIKKETNLAEQAIRKKYRLMYGSTEYNKDSYEDALLNLAKHLNADKENRDRYKTVTFKL